MTTTLEAPADAAGGAYYDALEHMSRVNLDFARFLKERADLAHRNDADYEAKTGRIAHRDRCAASEAQYILQQFERLTR